MAPWTRYHMYLYWNKGSKLTPKQRKRNRKKYNQWHK